jgi:hypothetical protein
MTGNVLRAALGFALLAAGCSKSAPPRVERLALVVENRSGAELRDVALYGAEETVSFESLPDGQLHRRPVTVKARGPLVLKLGGGPRNLDWTLDPSQNTGQLNVTLLPGGEVKLAFRPIVSLEPKDTLEGNVADARRFYDALRPGMPAADAMAILGHAMSEKPRWGTSKNFGYSGKKGTVTLQVEVADGVLERVSILHAVPPRQGEAIDQKTR